MVNLEENNIVIFKGEGDGLRITINDNDIDEIKKEIDSKISASKNFFLKGRVKKIIGKSLTPSQIKEIENFLINQYNMTIIKQEDMNKKTKIKNDSNVQIDYTKEGRTKFVNNTVRSGQVIDYEGNVVVMGDVNPGGVISAAGNIIVFGTLKGIAKAGKNGNKSAIIGAIKLEPTQLKIGNIISRKPDEVIEVENSPEIAKIKDNLIIIEPYLQKKAINKEE